MGPIFAPTVIVPISLSTIRSVASVVARNQGNSLEVVGVVDMGGYVEILLLHSDRIIDRCRVMLDPSSDLPAEDLHSTIAEAFERRLGFRDEAEGSAGYTEGP